MEALEAGLFGFEFTHIMYYSYDNPISNNRMFLNENKKTEILSEQYKKAKDIISKNMDKIEMLHNTLINNKMLTTQEIELILKQ